MKYDVPVKLKNHFRLQLHSMLIQKQWWENITATKPTINSTSIDLWIDRFCRLCISLIINYKYTLAFLCIASLQLTRKHKTKIKKLNNFFAVKTTLTLHSFYTWHIHNATLLVNTVVVDVPLYWLYSPV